MTAHVRRSPSGRIVRPDIQALRALAVVLVIVTHAWPDALSGGSLGVDVFFVISGYLITSLLVEERAREGKLAMGAFYLRRVARLLPAALTVIAVTAIATFLLLPSVYWRPVAAHVVASGAYVLNWELIRESASYAAADQGASPLQHFWSLAVEEQYYLVVPLLVVIMWRFGGRALVFAVTGLTTALSLGFALGWNPENPATTYFNTATRWWEFGIGGIVAIAGWSVSTRWRLPAQLVGLAAIIGSAFLLDAETRTPGWTTLAPTLGALLFLMTRPLHEVAASTPLDRVLGLRPVQYIGDASYSLYLWHWPVLVIAPFVTGDLSTAGSATAVALAFLLTAVTRPFEDRLRRRITSARRPQGLGWIPVRLATMAVVVAVALGGALTLADRNVTAGSPDPTLSSSVAQPCLGAAALADPERCSSPAKGVTPDPREARRDMPEERCKESLGGREVIECDFGSGTVSVALVGDSHAQRWIPALQPLLKARGWKLTTYLKSSCPFSAVPPRKYESACREWNEKVADRLADKKYDIVLVSSAAGLRYVTEGSENDAEAGIRGMQGQWKPLLDQGSQVIVLKDTPQPGFARVDPPACVLAKGPGACLADEKRAMPLDPMVGAAKELDVPVVDLTRLFCSDGTCPAVIGGVLVYRDGQHIHSAYARTVSPYLDDALTDALD